MLENLGCTLKKRIKPLSIEVIKIQTVSLKFVGKEDILSGGEGTTRKILLNNILNHMDFPQTSWAPYSSVGIQ